MDYDEVKEVILQTIFEKGWTNNLYVYYLRTPNEHYQMIQKLSVLLADLDYDISNANLNLRNSFTIFINLDSYFFD